jgi:hypothetical protein
MKIIIIIMIKNVVVKLIDSYFNIKICKYIINKMNIFQI